MPRLPRLVLPGVPHHVTQRGNRRLPIFFSDDDRRAYLDLIAEGARASDTRCLAWCLMDNHLHLILVPAHEDGLRAMLGEAHRRYMHLGKIGDYHTRDNPTGFGTFHRSYPDAAGSYIFYGNGAANHLGANDPSNARRNADNYTCLVYRSSPSCGR